MGAVLSIFSPTQDELDRELFNTCCGYRIEHNLKTLRDLLQKGANPNRVCRPFGLTPVEMAAREGNDVFIKAFLDHAKTDFDARIQWRCPLGLYLMNKVDCSEVLCKRMYHRMTTRGVGNYNILHFALCGGQFEFALWMIKKGNFPFLTGYYHFALLNWKRDIVGCKIGRAHV